MPDRCATRAVQLHLLAAISWFCVVSGCTGFVQHAVLPTQPGTAPWYVSDRINTRAKHAHIFHCFAALIVQLQLRMPILITAACTGFVQQVVESGYRPARSFRPTEHIQPGDVR
jgi:hypothetical protein